MAADTEKLLQENAADQIGAGHALLTGHSWSQVKTHNKKIYMNGDVALKNVKYEHTNRPGFLLGLQEKIESVSITGWNGTDKSWRAESNL